MTKAGQIAGAIVVAGLLGGAEARLASQQQQASMTPCTVQALQTKAPKGTTITDAKPSPRPEISLRTARLKDTSRRPATK
jgi:hypothetical protein